MKLSVLVSTMNQKDHSIIEKLNIQTDAIIVNQCNVNRFETIKYNNCLIKFLSLNEKGVGLSRNTALMRAQSDIVLFADEDEILENNYEQIIIEAFKNNKKADMILFNVVSLNDRRKNYNIKKVKRVYKFNCSKYGAVRIAVKLDKLKENNIFFSLLYGGGAKYSNGEDSIFIMDCIKSKMKVYTSPEIIGSVSQEKSTWFSGYTKKFFNDRGVLFKKLYGFNYIIRTLFFLIRIHPYYKDNISFFKAFKYMLNCN